MNNTVTFLGLASISLLGFTTNLSANAQIPQTSTQTILIEGESNQVNQQLNQNLNLNFIYLPQIEESVIPTFNVRETFPDNTNNQVDRVLSQNVLDFPLVDTSLTSFNINDFLNNDNILNGVQFITQEVFVDGDRNFLTQQSSQTLTDFIWLDSSSATAESEDFSDFLNELLVTQELDSFQFGLQDTFVFGNNNIVDQTIEQTFNSFIFTSNNLDSLFETDLGEGEIELDPVQFTIQETSLFSSQNNLISQNIDQVISDITFFDASNFSQQQELFEPNNNAIVETNNAVYFDIDAFINAILNDTIVEATQINRQRIQTIGNDNTDTQENVQVLVVSVPEPSSLKTMVVLLVIIGIQSRYKKRRSLSRQN